MALTIMQMNKRRWMVISAGMVIILFLGLNWIRAPKTIMYEAIELPENEGFPHPYDLHINDLGVVAGTMTWKSDNRQYLFLWDPVNGIKDIGKPDFIPPDDWIRIIDFNNKGQIVAEFGPEWIDQPVPCRYVFFDPETGYRKIENPDLPDFALRAMNDSGQVVGFSPSDQSDGRSQSWVVVWDPQTGLRYINQAGHPQDINNDGHILGQENRSVFLWTPQEGCRILKEIPFQAVCYLKVNDFDEVLGTTYRWDSVSNGFGADRWNSRVVVFRWSLNAGFQNLMTIDQQGYVSKGHILAIDEQKVLYLQSHEPFNWFGLLKHRESVPQIELFSVGDGRAVPRSLPPLYLSALDDGADINNSGWIVGNISGQAYVMIPKRKSQ